MKYVFLGIKSWIIWVVNYKTIRREYDAMENLINHRTIEYNELMNKYQNLKLEYIRKLDTKDEEINRLNENIAKKKHELDQFLKKKCK